MDFAENYARPVEGELGTSFPRSNDFGELFYIRWGRIRFELFWGAEVNLKVVLRVCRDDGTCERFIVDTDPYDCSWDRHRRATRDFYLHPFPLRQGRIRQVRFSYIAHVRWRSIPSQHEYVFMEACHFDQDRPQWRLIGDEGRCLSDYRTREVDAELLQRDVDWHNRHFDSLRLTPKFTKGTPGHHFHPKRYIHDRIDSLIGRARSDHHEPCTIKVCVDCIDDRDFVNHLLHARDNGIRVECIVDWRKMTLTNSDSYARLKRAGIELLGVFCSGGDSRIEVETDMHNKFIIFGEEDCLFGSFNITFERWWANWESGMTFRSFGMCRLMDNIFQSMRGGVIQRYGIDPLSRFNLLYTFGRHHIMNGKYYRPHQAIISEIHRARHSIKLCLFVIGEMQGEHHDSVVDALIQARARGVDVQIILNGHLARQGSPDRPCTMQQELGRPLLPAVERLKRAGIPVGLAYGLHDRPIPYSPLHSKYCIIDDCVVLDGCFNWYNTSVFSHDLLAIASSSEVAGPYLYEFGQILSSFRIYR